MKTHFNPKEALANGCCGYEDCEHALMPVSCDSEDLPIACEAHYETWQTGYSYLTEVECQRMHNTDTNFQECMNRSHVLLHQGGEAEFPKGCIDKGRQNYQKCKKSYGAWTLSAPWKISLMFLVNPFLETTR